LAEPPQALLSNCAEVTVITGLVRVFDHTPHGGCTGFIGTEDAIVADHFRSARCAYLVVTIISQGTQITVITRIGIGGDLTACNRVTELICAGITIFTEVGSSGAFTVHAKILIGANVIVTARTINGDRVTANVGNAAIDGALIIVLTIDGDTS